MPRHLTRDCGLKQEHDETKLRNNQSGNNQQRAHSSHARPVECNLENVTWCSFVEDISVHGTGKRTFIDTASSSQMLDKDSEFGRRTTSIRECNVSVWGSCGTKRAQQRGTFHFKHRNVPENVVPIKLDVPLIQGLGADLVFAGALKMKGVRLDMMRNPPVVRSGKHTFPVKTKTRKRTRSSTHYIEHIYPEQTPEGDGMTMSTSHGELTMPAPSSVAPLLDMPDGSDSVEASGDRENSRRCGRIQGHAAEGHTQEHWSLRTKAYGGEETEQNNEYESVEYALVTGRSEPSDDHPNEPVNPPE